jgi:hypothetical protein
MIVLAIALYSAGWVYAAGRLRDAAMEALEVARSEGLVVDCAQAEVRGYPFRLGLFCEDVSLAAADTGWSISAGPFRSAAQIYRPAHMVAELDGSAVLMQAGRPLFEADWNLLRASARLAEPLPARLSVEVRQPVVRSLGNLGTDPLATAAQADLHMRTRGDDVDLAWRIEALALPPAVTNGRPLPPLDVSGNITLSDSARLLAGGIESLRGLSGEIHQIRIEDGQGAAVTLRGAGRVRPDGLIDGSFTLSLEGSDRVAALVSGIFAGDASTFAESLASLGEGAEFPVRIEAGRITAGFVPVGRIPPL